MFSLLNEQACGGKKSCTAQLKDACYFMFYCLTSRFRPHSSPLRHDGPENVHRFGHQCKRQWRDCPVTAYKVQSSLMLMKSNYDAGAPETSLTCADEVNKCVETRTPLKMHKRSRGSSQLLTPTWTVLVQRSSPAGFTVKTCSFLNEELLSDP